MNTTLRHTSCILTLMAIAGPAAGQATTRVNLDSDGSEANGASDRCSVSGDGGHVAFDSFAGNLPADTASEPDVFVHDVGTGTTTWVAAGRRPAASYDGRFVALEREVGGTTQVEVYDGTTLIFTSAADSFFPTISSSSNASLDGRFIAYATYTALQSCSGDCAIPGGLRDCNLEADIYLEDLLLTTTELISAGVTGCAGDNHSFETPSISENGEVVAFSSLASSLVAGDANFAQDVFVRYRGAHPLTGTTVLVSERSAGGGVPGNASSGAPVLSGDGRYVAFLSHATDLVAGDTNGRQDVFVRDLMTGTTERVNVSTAGAQADDSRLSGIPPGISFDGRYVTFASYATNLVAGDTNGTADVFVRDRTLSTTERVSESSFRAQGDSFSFYPSMSHDGRTVGFISQASNLLTRGCDANFLCDVYVHRAEVAQRWRLGPPRNPPAATSRTDPATARPSTLDKVHLYNGELHLTEVDLRIPGRGFDFVWARTYRSRGAVATEMGTGWDHSYNIKVERVDDGPDPTLRLYDGGNRRDLLRLDGGLYVADAFFMEGVENTDGSFTFTLSDRTEWNLHPLDGQPHEGKIESIVDRNGNTMSFAYDGQGRLTTIADTLDRAQFPRLIDVTYDGDGRIATVSDFSGRTVVYTYYGPGDPSGPEDDLRTVRSPTVTGTPHGNDFPGGKTTTYTYTAGGSCVTLEHNLLTITDPRGQQYLRATYAATTDQGDPDFDSLVRMELGDACGATCDVINLAYLDVAPGRGNNFAVRMTVENDRAGNVAEYFYDDDDLLVMEREYTGRAPDDDSPTTDVANRPTGPLRVGDPVFFETRYAYDANLLLTQVTYPELNTVQYTYEPSLVAPRMEGANVRQVLYDRGPRAADQNQILLLYEYLPGYGGADFLTLETDARGFDTVHTYDGNGNRDQTTHRDPAIVETFGYNAFGQLTTHVWPDNGSVPPHLRVDGFTYYTNPNDPQFGFRQSEVLDLGNENVTTVFQYDDRANPIAVTDPRGHTTDYVVNALNQIVRETSREVVDASGVRYVTDYFYDLNDNLIRVETDNRDPDGVVQPGGPFATIAAYDSLNALTLLLREASPTSTIVLLYDYDANHNRTLVRHGESAAGEEQPNNVTRTLYDERDLVFQVVRAEGDPGASTTQYDYDGNANPTRVEVGVGTVAPRVHTHTYDGFDRLGTSVDPMGNAVSVTYDANGNRTNQRTDGEPVDVPGSALNVRLSETTYTYDDMDRMTRSDVAHFVADTGAAVGDGFASTCFDYSPGSQLVAIVDDRTNTTLYEYDTMNRVATVTDALGNATAYTYDASSNPTVVTETELSDGGAPNEVFTTTYIYDNLDRQVAVTDNAGNVQVLGYDSRHNLGRLVDGRGSVTNYTYDGVNRLLEVEHLLTADGTGGGAPAGAVVTRLEWDDSSRLTARVDGSGNRTEYEYDALNRRVAVVYADDSRKDAAVYDAYDNVTRYVDAVGTTVDATYDGLDRLITTTVTPGAGVANDTLGETYGYDGLSRLVAATDADAVVTRAYDSLGRVLAETLDGITTQSAYDGMGNPTALTYPSGRQVARTYDALNRVKAIDDLARGVIGTYDYRGPARVELRGYVNDTATTYTYDAARRVSGTTQTDVGGVPTVLDDRTYAWNAIHGKASATDVLGAATRSYEYDSLNRLVGSAGGDGTRIYGYDAVGNRRFVTAAGTGQPPGGTGGGRTFQVGGPGGTRMPDQVGVGVGTPGADAYFMGPADRPLNQYTTTPFDQRSYDANGNVTSVVGTTGTVTLVYDYLDRLVEHTDSGSGVTTRYTYDALGRRTRKLVGAVETRFYYDGWQVAEERDGANQTQATYVYGSYVDEVLNMSRGLQEYYVHTDDQHSVVAVTDGAGTVVERYAYTGDFGEHQVLDGAGTPIAGSAIENPYRFTGRRFDPESGYLFYRTRLLDPKIGRFLTRDTLGIWGDPANLGNGTTLVANNPASLVDPFGLAGRAFSLEAQRVESARRDVLARGAELRRRERFVEDERFGWARSGGLRRRGGRSDAVERAIPAAGDSAGNAALYFADGASAAMLAAWNDDYVVPFLTFDLGGRVGPSFGHDDVYWPVGEVTRFSRVATDVALADGGVVRAGGSLARRAMADGGAQDAVRGRWALGGSEAARAERTVGGVAFGDLLDQHVGTAAGELARSGRPHTSGFRRARATDLGVREAWRANRRRTAAWHAGTASRLGVAAPLQRDTGLVLPHGPVRSDAWGEPGADRAVGRRVFGPLR